MESSTVIAFRVLVMLTCLVVVPLAAVFGSAFPDVVKSMLVDRFLNATKTITGPERPDAPAFAVEAAPQWRAEQGPDATSSSISASGNLAQQPNLPVALAAAGDAPGWGGHAVQHAGGPNVPPSETHTASATMAAPHAEPSPATGMILPAASVSAPPNRTAGETPIAQTLSQPDRFTWMERRLREFGATYYLLETWGNDGELYRFHCKMAIANNPSRTRQFEATESDALRAMGRVVEQVEAWRAGRLP